MDKDLADRNRSGEAPRDTLAGGKSPSDDRAIPLLSYQRPGPLRFLMYQSGIRCSRRDDNACFHFKVTTNRPMRSDSAHIVRLLALGLIIQGGVIALAQQAPEPPAPNIRDRPNILWISLEDISPDWRCYGDAYANTSLLDRFAKQSVRFTRVFTHAPVCAPSRSGIITGMYPTSIATHHMRTKAVTPPEGKCFTEYLRAAGYYCTNNVKTDYQFDPPFTAWDESSNRAHWRGRRTGQPFFAVFNFTVTHESQVRDRSPQTRSLVAQLSPDQRHDPAKAILPPYYPDTPLVRRDWANYHDNITAVQKLVGGVLEQLDEDGLADDTIVWIWGDHGRGLPRGKRWVYDSGLQAPLLVRIPEKWRALVEGDRAGSWQPGSVNADLVAFVDFAPTVLSLAGIDIPKHMQGQAFLGAKKPMSRKYVFAARDRMDERYDVIRAVRDKQFKYIRNFMPHLPYAQRIAYMDLMPTMREWRRLHADGKLDGPAAAFFQATKPIEELYDTELDPHEIKNLAGDPSYAKKLGELREELVKWMIQTQDLGLVPEPILDRAQRPNDSMQATAPPVALAARSVKDGGTTLSLSSSTAGASIGYRIDGDRSPWQLYHRPLTLKGGQSITAKACRIGFRDSGSVSISATSEGKSSEPNAPRAGVDWRPTVVDESVLRRLLALKEHDRDPSKAVSEYEQALADSHPAMRYWAVVGTLLAAQSRPPEANTLESLRKLAQTDDSQVVRIAAAHAICRLGETERGLPVLAAGLESRLPSLQLQAALALEDLGEQARPLLPRLNTLAEESSEYVERVSAHIVEQLGGEG